MQDKKPGLIELFRREPEQVKLLMKLTAGGAITIVVWQLLTELLLSLTIGLPVTLILVILDGVAIAYFTARLVHDADRWEIDSAVSAHKLATPERSHIARPDDATSPISTTNSVPDSGVERASPMNLPMADSSRFQHEYFLIRLQDEVARARREGHGLSLVALQISVPGMDSTPESRAHLDREIAQMASNQRKEISHSLAMEDSQFVFSLPEMGRDASRAFLSKMVQGLGNYWCHYGLAVYPEDGTDAATLFDFVCDHLEQSLNDGKAANGRSVGSLLRQRSA